MRVFDITRSAGNFIASLPPKQFKQVVSKVLELGKNPRPNDSEKLKGFDFYRVDIGEYRIIYSFDDKSVIIREINKRNDDAIYKKLRS